MGGEELALIGAAIAVGIGAALLPVFVNAEVYVVTMGATVNSKPFLALLILIHVAATTVGKAFVFQLARKGTNKIRMVNPKPPRNRVAAMSASICSAVRAFVSDTCRRSFHPRGMPRSAPRHPPSSQVIPASPRPP